MTDDHYLMASFRRADARAAIERHVADVLTANPHLSSPMFYPSTDDRAALRGIPVVGVRGGYGGAVRGTRPGGGMR